MTRLALTLTAAILLNGCGFFSRPEVRYFSLETIEPETGIVSIEGSPVAIEALELPPGLDRRGLVLREESPALTIRETDLWAAPFETMVLHTLAHDVAARIPPGMIVLPGQTKPAGAVRPIEVVFEEIAAGPDDELRLIAHVEIGGTTTVERVTEPMGSLASDEVAMATSRALAVLADRIVARLSPD